MFSVHKPKTARVAGENVLFDIVSITQVTLKVGGRVKFLITARTRNWVSYRDTMGLLHVSVQIAGRNKLFIATFTCE